SRPVLLSLEKDADLNAVLMAGSQAFSEALELQQKVQMSWQTNLQLILNDGQTTLVDDFAGLVKKTIDRDTTKDVLDSADPASTRTSLRPLSERIADARADNTQGILALDIPSRDLFRDFPRLCKQLTPFFYRELGLNFSMQNLQPVMLDDQQHGRETRLLKQLAEYTSSTFLPDVVWDTACAASIAKMSDEKKLAFIEAAIKQFRTSLPEFGETLNHYQNTRRKSVELISLNARLEQNYVDGDFVKQQTETLQKEQHKFQRYNDILGTYRRCSGLRISCAVLLLQDRKKKLRGLRLLGYLQTLHGIQKDLHAAYLVYELIRTLYGRILEHAEIELQKTLETQVRQLTDANRLIYATLVKLPGKLKGVDSLSSLLDEQLQDARGKSTDPTKQTLNVFATLAGLYRNLNQNISGQLASLAGESERQRNIQPVRLIPKDGHKNAA
ncbi:MAG: hypothetical protein KDJ38_17710, partial [Gammaproteobacteria bacterium]|nr:hypothetical protein [Gammaproteobacteria bacterium]